MGRFIQLHMLVAQKYKFILAGNSVFNAFCESKSGTLHVGKNRAHSIANPSITLQLGKLWNTN
jgi:hypothetical protein